MLEDCVIDVSTLKRFRRHKYFAAPVSLEAFLKELEEESVEYGAQVRGYTVHCNPSLQIFWLGLYYLHGASTTLFTLLGFTRIRHVVFGV